MKLLLFLLVPLLLPETSLMAQTPPAPSPDQAALVQGNNAFAVDLYGQLRKQNGNLFFSPESISTAFAMAFAGARGSTASEMAATFHFSLPPDRLHSSMAELLSSLNSEHPGYRLRVANALWVEEDFRFLDDFLKLTASDYGAGFNRVDFKSTPEAVRGTINLWVEQKTEEKIKDLLPAGSINATTRMVLTNAIYFKGDWQSPFKKEATAEEDFHLSAAQKVKTSLMHLTARFNYFNGGTFQILDIPYKSGELSMVVLLPNDVEGLAALEKSLTAVALNQWFGQLRGGSRVILTLPKFKMTESFQLGKMLTELGMGEAFQKNAADFSAMTGKRALWISAAIHKAYIDVDEEGTEAAAATGIVMRPSAVARVQPPIVFRADHPFLFLIRDNKSGGVLFMGRVANPTQ